MSEKRTRSLSQSTTAELNHNKAPECLVHNQTFCGSIYSKKNLLHVTKFCYEKSLTKVCYERTLLQNCRLKQVIRNGNVSSYISVSVHHTLRNFKKFFFGKWYIADY